MDMLEVVLDAGADVNKTDSDGLTPLVRAASLNTPLLVAYLLEKGASYSDKLWKNEDLSVDIL